MVEKQVWAEKKEKSHEDNGYKSTDGWSQSWFCAAQFNKY